MHWCWQRRVWKKPPRILIFLCVHQTHFRSISPFLAFCYSIDGKTSINLLDKFLFSVKIYIEFILNWNVLFLKLNFLFLNQINDDFNQKWAASTCFVLGWWTARSMLRRLHWIWPFVFEWVVWIRLWCLCLSREFQCVESVCWLLACSVPTGLYFHLYINTWTPPGNRDKWCRWKSRENWNFALSEYDRIWTQRFSIQPDNSVELTPTCYSAPNRGNAAYRWP